MITKTTIPEDGWVYFDEYGFRMPWYTLPCLEWLNEIDLGGRRVFEYGVGHSTSWFMSREAITFGVESNEEWANPVLGSGRHMWATGKDLYISAINAFNPYDIIVIDGIHRDDCTEHALKKLKKGGYLICDNFEQPSVQADWPKTRELTKDLPLTIYKQPDHYDWQTAVWRKT